MRIAITVDPYIPVPPELYGSIERVLALLVDGLVARGDDVVLLAHPESRTKARLVPYGAPPHTGGLDRARELFQVGIWLWRHSHELDVVHSFGRLAALLPILPQTRLVKIQSYQRAIPWAGVGHTARLARQSLSFTGCSSAMYKNPIAGEWHTVYNCVDVGRYDFVARVPDEAPLMFLGRIESTKGTHEAIQIALPSGRDLVVAGNRVDDDGGYFEDKVEPFVDGQQIRYVGPVDDEAKNALLGQASAFLMPIGWEEPFGIVMAEAVEAVQRIPSLSRQAARRDAEERFSSTAILRNYLELYDAQLAMARGAQFDTAASTASILPAKKWSLPGITTSSLGSGTRSSKLSMAAASPNGSSSPWMNNLSFSIDSTKCVRGSTSTGSPHCQQSCNARISIANAASFGVIHMASKRPTGPSISTDLVYILYVRPTTSN